MNQLIKYDAARYALQQAVEVDEVKDIRDKAQAMAAYAKQAKDTELVQWATEIKVRAERKAGQILAGMPKAQGELRNSSWSHDATTTKLADLGINKTQSSRWQKLAAVPEDQFEQAVFAAKEIAGEVTTAAMLRVEKANRMPRTATTQPNNDEVGVSESPKKETTTEQEIDTADEEYTEADQMKDALEALREENDRLSNQLAAMLFDGTDEERAEYLNRLNDQTNEIKSLTNRLAEMTASRNSWQTEVADLKSQVKRQRRELDKIQKPS